MVSKIDSIRPGGMFAGTFREYPLPELLFGILRANLSGKVDFDLGSEARNRVFFRDGVPIGVELPDSGLTIVTLAIERGFVGTERALEVQKIAESKSTSVARLLVERALITPVDLDVLQAELARHQMLRLFDHADLGFRFTEGVGIVEDCPLAILEPLPLVFRGLRAGRDRNLSARFLDAHERSVFMLAPTFPSGVDPFHWGEALCEAAQSLGARLSIASLIEAGIERETAIAALHGLLLAGMVDLKEVAATERRADVPRNETEIKEPVAKQPTQPPKEPGGLQIHRRVDKAPTPTNVDPPRAPSKAKTGPTPVVSPAPVSPHDQLYADFKDKLTPLKSQSYFQLLRISPSTDATQIERAYRFLIRRLDEEGDDPGRRAVKDLIKEAYACLKDPARSRRYVEMVEGEKKDPILSRERQALEAEPKVERALRALGENRTGEASFLLGWAEKQDPKRKDIGVLNRMVDYIRSTIVERSVEAKSLGNDLERLIEQRPDDIRLKLCYAFLYADTGDARSAVRLLQEIGETDHPLKKRVQLRIR